MKRSLPFFALAFVAAIFGAKDAQAQDYMKFLEPVTEWSDFEFELKGGHEFARDDELSDQDFNMTSVDYGFGSTLYADKEFGLGFSGNFGYHDLKDSAPLVPDELVSASLGLQTSFSLGGKSRFFGMLSASTNNDNEDFEAEDITVSLVAAVSFPISKEWMLVPGLFFSSTTTDGRTAPVPIPMFEAIYMPSRDFTLIIGAPATGFFWSPNEWMKITAFSFLLNSWNASVAEIASETVTFDQFYRYTGESYRLTDERFHPDDHTVNSKRHEIGVGMTYAPSWKRESGYSTELTLRFEWAVQVGYKWEIRDDEFDLVGDPLRLEPGNAFRVSLGYSF